MPSPRNDKPHNRHKSRPSLAVRINRAADDLNPFLVLVAVGLLLLNLTLYLGMTVSSPQARLPATTSTAQTGLAAPGLPQAGR